MGDHSRRKRRDPQSRDFLCKCGKSYLSYAAAYTHVKNKHDGNKQFYNGIQKPCRENLTRGRPKQKKLNGNTSQTKSLSIIQEAILKIYQQLRKQSQKQDQSQSKIILDGNQFTKAQDLQTEYQKINIKNVLTSNIFQKKDEQSNDELIKRFLMFESSINKHFNAPIAAKIRYFLNYLYEKNCKSYESQKQNIEYHQVYNLWKDNKINQLISNAFNRWSQIKAKEIYNQ